MKKIILASASPRRKFLLNMLLSNFGLTFSVVPSNIEEYFPEKIKNLQLLVSKLALQKSLEVAKKKKGIIIGADTVVVLGNNILGKPTDADDAKKMLKLLSGKTHKVITGVGIIDTIDNKVYRIHESTQVTFRKLDKKEIHFYVQTGSPMDKAGAYGIQDDFGSTFVSKIAGDYFNIVGLPIVKTYLALKKALDISI